MITADNPTSPATAPRLNFLTTGAGWVERTRCFTDTGEELAPNLNFPANNWRGNPHRCIAAASYPLVFVPAAPDAIPSELLALQDDTPIVARRETAPYDAIAKAGVIRAEVADAIERHKHGLYTAREIAHLSYKSASASSRTYSGDSESEYQEMASAFESGRLIAFKRTGKLLRDSEIRQFPGVLSQSSAALNAMNDCWFKLDDVNAWLESERATWRLQSPSAPSASAPAVALPEPVAAPAEAVPVSAGIVRHAIKARRDPLASVFARAMQDATDSACPHSVWAALVAMATGNAAPPELTDYREDKGLQATGVRGGWLSKSAFLDRWRRGSVQPRQPALSRANTR